MKDRNWEHVTDIDEDSEFKGETCRRKSCNNEFTSGDPMYASEDEPVEAEDGFKYHFPICKECADKIDAANML